MLNLTLDLINKHNLNIKTDLDEQRLIDQIFLNKLISLADIKKNDIVLEIGPGIGNITNLIAEKSSFIYAIEKNPKFKDVLKDRFGQHKNIKLIIGNALNLKWPKIDKIISNIQYSITEALIQKLTDKKFILAVLIVPKSFSIILTSKTGEKKFTKLSFISSLFFEVKEYNTIPPSAYFPKPRISTTIITLRPRNYIEPWEKVLRSTILSKSKKTRNALSEALIQSCVPIYPSTKRNASKFIESLNLIPEITEKRVARLSLEDLRLLKTKLST